MKIAIPVTKSNKIDNHFGHCEYYSVLTISEEGNITNEEKLDSPQGCGCKSNIAGVLADKGVTVMLAGGIGGGAIHVLNNAGIEVVRGCSGNATETALKYISGNIKDSGVSCIHHEHQLDHGLDDQCNN